MFALSIALFALAMIAALFGFRQGVGTFIWLMCVVFSVIAMTMHWRQRDQAPARR